MGGCCPVSSDLVHVSLELDQSAWLCQSSWSAPGVWTAQRRLPAGATLRLTPVAGQTCPQTILPGGDPLPAGQAGRDRRGEDQGKKTARNRAGLAGAGPVVAADAPAGPTVAVAATSVLRLLQLVLSLAAGGDSAGPRHSLRSGRPGLDRWIQAMVTSAAAVMPAINPA
jgi:hypothetical protein